MKPNDLTQFFCDLTVGYGITIKLSEEDIDYLSEETDIWTCQIDITSNDIQQIKSEISQQIEWVADNFSRYLFLLEMDSAHLSLAKELVDFVYEEYIEKQIKWGLKLDSQMQGLRITIVLSRKTIGTLNDFLNLYEFKDLVPYIQQLYSCAPIEDIKGLYEQMKNCKTILTEKTICVSARWEGCSPMIDMNACILDERRVIVSPVGFYSSLSELINMNIYVEDSVCISKEEILSGILLEMVILPPSSMGESCRRT